MRFRLRTLMIVLALGPMVLVVVYFQVDEYQGRQRATAYLRRIAIASQNDSGGNIFT